MAVPGISTIGALLGYAVETSAGVKPTSFKLLTRINAIGGISNDVETIDASALEDEFERTIAGRGSSGGTFPVTINLTDDTLTEWETLITAYKEAKASGKQMWFETYLKDLKKGIFVIAEPPTVIPAPELAQNGLLTLEMNLTINEYKGFDTAIKPTSSGL